jgi:hypothetical protein
VISKFQMRSILDYLDLAITDIARTETPGHESNAAWALRLARTDLYAAAIGDVEIETQPAAMLRAA